MKMHSLSGRIALWLGVVTVMILGAAAMAMDRMVDAEMSRRFDDGLLAQAQTLTALVNIGAHGLDMDDIGRVRPHLLTGRASVAYAIRCADGSTTHSEPAPARYPSGWASAATAQPVFANIDVAGHALRAVWFRFNAGYDSEQGTPLRGAAGQVAAADACRVVVMQSRDELDEILTAIDGILLLTPALALLLVLLLSPVLVRRGLKPLTTLGDAMRDIGPQAVGQRLQATGTRELEPLVLRFNEVLARMDEGVTRERQFAGALAHETRTHLAELRVLVEVEQRYPSERPLEEVLVEIGKIVGELQGTVSGLLLLTRLEAGIEGMDPDNVRLDKVLNRQLESAAEPLHRRRLHVNRPAAPHDGVLVADRALLDIIVGNLVSNAVAYAPEGSTIGIRRQRCALIIDNDVPDVDVDEVARFGQRFWSKHHGTDGHAGLGLALAGAAASAMHFKLHFTLDAQQRLHATLSWPESLEVVRLA